MRIFEITTLLTIDDVIKKFQIEFPEDIEYGNERDNCGFVASSFSTFAKQFGLNVPRIHGTFQFDNPDPDIKMFHQSELKDMEEEGYNFHSEEDRMTYIQNNGLEEEFSKANHYWNEYQGRIIDFSGKAQFIDSGLASDLDSSRYKPNA